MDYLQLKRAALVVGIVLGMCAPAVAQRVDGGVRTNGALGGFTLTPSAQPGDTTNGHFYYDSGCSCLKVANGSTWATVGGSVTALGTQISWTTGLGAITHILGPSDQTLKISANGSGTLMQLVSPGNGGISFSINSNTPLNVQANTIFFQSTSQPTVTTCGTGAVTTGSTNNAGEVTATGATACTVNFTNGQWTLHPYCVIEDETTAVAQNISAISTSSFTVSGLTSGDKFMYVCFGK